MAEETAAEKPPKLYMDPKTWAEELARFAMGSQREDPNCPPATPFTDEQLGFRADEDLRAGISSYSAVRSQNDLLLQVCRIADRILKRLEAQSP